MDSVERFRGCLLGLALGDSMGAPFEGSYPGLTPVFPGDLPDVLRYTDDTEMAIGVAESLIFSKRCDPDEMARRFSENYHPFRGYGPGAAAILNMVRQGIPWSEANTKVFRNGSFGNGAAMRVAPLGLFYSKNAERLRIAVEEASSITHAHALGKEGAVILAYAISLVLAGTGQIEKLQFLDSLVSFTQEKEYARKLNLAKELLQSTEEGIETIVSALGHGVLAPESVPAAIYAFLLHGSDFQSTIGFCISLGGDTDTIGAMAGALSGCHVGDQFLPREWLSRLENTEKGRDYIARIAEDLHTSYLSYR